MGWKLVLKKSTSSWVNKSSLHLPANLIRCGKDRTKARTGLCLYLQNLCPTSIYFVRYINFVSTAFQLLCSDIQKWTFRSMCGPYSSSACSSFPLVLLTQDTCLSIIFHNNNWKQFSIGWWSNTEWLQDAHSYGFLKLSWITHPYMQKSHMHTLNWANLQIYWCKADKILNHIISKVLQMSEICLAMGHISYIAINSQQIYQAFVPS